MTFFRKIIEIVIVFYPFIVSGEINQTVKNGVFELSLTQTEEGCHLVYTSPSTKGDLALQVISPCNFHRSPEGKVRIMPTPKGDVLLIESSRPHSNFPKRCHTQIQGIRISHEQIKISSEVSKVLMCPPFQWDDVMFVGIFGRD
ncbi:MAG: hypothetical protein HC877_03705 [Thioploca sp.]|nr:hypothetical protein [Thioploca sp.]